MANITLTRLTEDDREQFILDNQYAFRYGAMEEFEERDDHFEEEGEIISRKTIEKSIESGAAYRIREDGRIVGGLVLKIDEKTQHNHLDLLLSVPKHIVKASALPHGRKLNASIRKQKSGRPVLHILRPETSTFMSINAVSISSSSSTAAIRIRMIPGPAKRITMTVKIPAVCSALRNR